MVSINGTITNTFELWSDEENVQLSYIPSYIKINKQQKQNQNTIWFPDLCLFLRKIMGLR